MFLYFQKILLGEHSIYFQEWVIIFFWSKTGQITFMELKKTPLNPCHAHIHAPIILSIERDILQIRTILINDGVFISF